MSVKDSGVGIREQDLNKLFKLCSFQIKDKDANTKGIGLGLTMCEHIIHALGGTIECTSKLGLGTEFIFRVKLDQRLPEELKQQIQS